MHWPTKQPAWLCVFSFWWLVIWYAIQPDTPYNLRAGGRSRQWLKAITQNDAHLEEVAETIGNGYFVLGSWKINCRLSGGDCCQATRMSPQQKPAWMTPEGIKDIFAKILSLPPFFLSFLKCTHKAFLSLPIKSHCGGEINLLNLSSVLVPGSSYRHIEDNNKH